MKLLEENREILDRISDHLYEKETISGKEFMKIFREMKGLPDAEDEKEKKQEPTVDVRVSDVIYVGPSEDTEKREEDGV
jgi:cell division protease FtsH